MQRARWERAKGWAPLVGVLALALVLRLWGIAYGLPHLYNWDEPTVVNRAMRFGSGDLNPHFFYYPTLWMYTLFALFGAYFGAGKLTGHFHSASDLGVEYFTDPTNTYLIARIATAVVGTLTVLAAYRVGARLWGRSTGLVAAAFLSVATVHVVTSQQAVTDVPHALPIVAAMVPILAIAGGGRRRDYALAGVLIGLGIATKYLAALLVVPLIVAHFARTRAGDEPAPRHADLGLALALVGLAFFVGAPYCLLDVGTLLRDLRAQSELSAGGSGTSFGYYLLGVLPADLGLPMLLLAVAGGLAVVRQKGPLRWVLLSFPVLYLLFVARYPKGFPRYVIPLEPFLVLLAAHAAVTFVRRVRKAAVRQATAVVLVAGALAYPAWAVVGWNRLVAGEVDPRTRAAAWFEGHVPADTTVAVQSLFDRTFTNAPVMTDRKLAMLMEYLPAGGRTGSARDRVREKLTAAPVYRDVPFDQALGGGAEYLLVSNKMGRIDPAALRGWSLAARFAPDAARLRGIPAGAGLLMELPPTISVYGREPGPGAVPGGP